MELEARFWSKANWDAHDDERCWQWLASLKPEGYGQFRFEGLTVYAHRMAYELEVGPIPNGLDLDHICRNRSCVNPSHLDPVTRKENIHRGDAMKLKSHCGSGHEYTNTNTYKRPDGYRECRACRKAARETR